MKRILPLLIPLLLPSLTAQEPSLEQRMKLHDQFLQAPRMITGGHAGASWLKNGSSFIYKDGWVSMFIDPEIGVPRPAKKTDRNLVAPIHLNRQRGRMYAPTSERYAVMDHGQIRLAGGDLGTGEIVTENGSKDFVWEVKPEGWSTDGSMFFSMSRDIGDVFKLPVVDFTKAIETVEFVPYLKTGTSFPKHGLTVFHIEDGSQTQIDLKSDEDIYLFPIGWRENNSELIFLRMNREASILDLMAADPLTGKSRVILTDRQKTFVGGLDFIRGGWKEYFTPIKENEQFLWISERSGWRHIYLYDYRGTMLQQVTQGEFPIQSVVGIDELKKRAFVMANAEERIYDTHFYGVNLDGSEFQKLSTGNGEHLIQLSPSRKCFIDTHSSLTDPPISELRSISGNFIATLSTADVSVMEGIGWVTPEPFQCKAADGVTGLHGVIFKPKYFDPNKKYPVIDYIYTGPFITVAPNDYRLGSHLAPYAQAMAQMGFITFIVDPRGTTERSKAFQDASYGRIGQIEIPDHAATLKQIAQSRPYMDLDHVGIYGHSWGGYFALRAMLTAPDVFHAGVAGAPGELTEAASINEPYMRIPDNNPSAYAAGMNAPLASNLRGKLMIIQGTADVNAPFSTSMRMVKALIDADKDFELLVFPGGAHGFRGAQKRYESKRIRSFFLKHLRGETGVWQ